jgi:hypothetical protein
MRDEGLLYERLLHELGIPTKLDVRFNPFFGYKTLAS